MIEPPGTAALRHLHFRASVHPPEGLYIWQLFNARYTDKFRGYKFAQVKESERSR